MIIDEALRALLREGLLGVLAVLGIAWGVWRDRLAEARVSAMQKRVDAKDDQLLAIALEFSSTQAQATKTMRRALPRRGDS